jgi:predicted PurR-regulated permease PerM
MSTDGEGTAEATRGLASRLRAATVERTRRSHALIRSRLSGEAGPAAAAVTPSPATVGAPPEAASMNSAAEASASPRPPALPVADAPAPAFASASGRDDESGKDRHGRRRGPAILQAADSHVPAPLMTAAAWAWRILLVAAVIYLAFKVAVALRLLVLPFIAAVLLCALLQPFAGRLIRAGLPRLAATWVTLLCAIAVLAGIGMLIANQVQAGYPELSVEVRRTVNQLLHFLSGPPFRLNGARLSQLTSKLVNYLAQHKTVVAGTVLTGGKYFIEVLAGVVLTIFITFFLLKDGEMLWSRLIRGLRRFRGAGPEAIERSDRASGAAWHALVRYIHGTTIIAVIHAAMIGIALWLLGVPLVAPIAILVFLAAYVPLIGILIVGALAILITLATQGWLAAVILLAVFLVENQLESHLLQPLIIGRAVRLHPLEVIIVLAIGGIVAGIPGAIVAVPTAAVVSAAWRSSQEPKWREREPPGDRRGRRWRGRRRHEKADRSV